jgi:hypothetical protein
MFPHPPTQRTGGLVGASHPGRSVLVKLRIDVLALRVILASQRREAIGRNSIRTRPNPELPSPAEAPSATGSSRASID